MHEKCAMHSNKTTKVQICIQYLYFIDFLPSEEKPRRPRAQTSVDVKALAQALEAQGKY